jgi:hypothetical protein
MIQAPDQYFYTKKKFFCLTKQAITKGVSTALSLTHRYIKNIDCVSFVVCPLLAPHLPRHFPFFAAAININNEANKAGSTCH